MAGVSDSIFLLIGQEQIISHANMNRIDTKY